MSHQIARVWIQMAFCKQLFVMFDMFCRSAGGKKNIHPALMVVSLLSFRLTWTRKNKSRAASHFTLDHSAGSSTAKVSPFVIQWACMRRKGDAKFEVPRHLSLNSVRRWKHDFPRRRQPGLSSTEVSWLCFQQENVSGTTSKALTVIAKWIFYTSSGAARLLSN